MLVRINTNVLNIRTSAGTAYKILGTITRDTEAEIEEVVKIGTMNWGKLKDKKGWICLQHTITVKE